MNYHPYPQNRLWCIMLNGIMLPVIWNHGLFKWQSGLGNPKLVLNVPVDDLASSVARVLTTDIYIYAYICVCVCVCVPSQFIGLFMSLCHLLGPRWHHSKWPARYHEISRYFTSGLKRTLPITTKFCTRHDSVTVVTCTKFRCDRLMVF